MMIINLLGIALIALIAWWFWLYQPNKAVAANNEISIEVKDGIYTPALIQVAANQPVILKFIRSDQSPCSEMLLIPSLEISEQLKLGEATEIHLTDLPAGDHEFHCQMQMYRGVLKVV